jgi:hypothetical protein
MISFRTRAVGLATTLILSTQLTWAAEQKARTDTGKIAPPSSTQKAGTTRPGAKGPLPDPVLLDGSTAAADKKSEYGMIGDFELPGDENARNGKVGGAAGGAGQQQSQQQGAGGLPMGLPQAGGQAPGAPQSGQQAAGGGAQANQQKDGQSGAAGEQGAKAEGIQVASLGGDPSGEKPGTGPGEKPPPVAIGDAAMRLPASQTAAGVVGAQQQQAAANTQQHDKGTGSGGKGPAGGQGSNRVEKGRAIPAGL